MKKLPLAMAVGVLILAVAVVMPTLIDASNDDATTTVEIDENRSQDLTDTLRVTSEIVRPTQDTATITVTSLRTLNSSTQQLDEGQTLDYVLDGQTVTVTLNAAQEEDSEEFSRLSVVYSPYFGWDNGARTVMENMGLVLALTAFIIIGAMLAGVSKL